MLAHVNVTMDVNVLMSLTAVLVQEEKFARFARGEVELVMHACMAFQRRISRDKML